MYVDIYTKYFDNFFAWPFNIDFYVNSIPLCLMVEFSIINFVCDNYLLLVMNFGNRNPYQIISFMIFQCSSELDLSKIAQSLGGNKRKILLKACLENEF